MGPCLLVCLLLPLGMIALRLLEVAGAGALMGQRARLKRRYQTFVRLLSVLQRQPEIVHVLVRPERQLRSSEMRTCAACCLGVLPAVVLRFFGHVAARSEAVSMLDSAPPRGNLPRT